MPTQQQIRFSSGPFRLVGTLHLPDVPQPPVIIGCHGLLADRESPKQKALAKACCQSEMAYFRFDHRGCGDSQGDIGTDTSLSSRCQDLYHAAALLQTHPEVGPLAGLFGSSFGGTVALAFAAKHPVPAIVTYAAPLDSASIRESAARQIESIHDKDGSTPLSAVLASRLAFDIRQYPEKIANILIIHGNNDEVVPIDHAYHLYRKAKDPKRLIVQEGGDHRMSDPSHQHYFLKESITWYKELTA